VLILALDSADAIGSAALLRSGTPAEKDEPEDAAFETLAPAKGQADRLIEPVEALLDKAGCHYRDLDLIAVNRGPGSFTGIRSAVALARGLALAAGLPVLGVTSLEALAAGAASSGRLLAAQDGRRGQVFVQPFAQAVDGDRRPLAPPAALAPEAAASLLEPTGAAPWRLAGSGARLVRDALAGSLEVDLDSTVLDARLVAGAALLALCRGERPTAGFELEPLYLRPPDARPPRPLVSPASSARTI
jgi:tRNA threonylcarbamoyladenosine biosynthesis protein TsaB